MNGHYVTDRPHCHWLIVLLANFSRIGWICYYGNYGATVRKDMTDYFNKLYMSRLNSYFNQTPLGLNWDNDLSQFVLPDENAG